MQAKWRLAPIPSESRNYQYDDGYGRAAAQRRAVRIVRDVTPDLPPLKPTGISLSKILFNLLSNAAKFTEQEKSKFPFAGERN